MSIASLVGRNANEAAKNRWLSPEEIFDLLNNYFSYGFALTPTPPQNPPSMLRILALLSFCNMFKSGGTLLLYDKNVVKRFRNDGVRWQTKKDSKSVCYQVWIMYVYK